MDNQKIKKANKLIANAVDSKTFTTAAANRLAKQLKKLGMDPFHHFAYIADARDQKEGKNKDGTTVTY